LEDPAIEKVGHNLKFDLKVLQWHGVQVKGALFDTMLAHALVWPEQRHGLDFVAQSLLGYSPVPIESLIGKRGAEQRTMKEVALDQLVEYAGEDADVTVQLRAVLEPVLAKAEQTAVFHDLEARLVPVLADMEVEGIRLDTGALAEFSQTLANQIAGLESEIVELAGVPFNLNSPKQLGEVLFDRLKLVDQPKRTRTGQYQTSEQVLAGLAAAHPIVGKILAYREATKLKSTYVDTLPDAVWPGTGRIHTTFSQLATATGRLASSNPNLQNIPIRSEQGQEIRKAFVARDADHVLLSADYSQIELRIMAALSGDSAMREAFDSGRDIHVATAARVHRVSPDNVTGEMRRQAKMINYGLMYGMSTFGLAQRLGIARTEAGTIVDAYFDEFPGIRAYIDGAIDFAREHGYVRTVSGRRRPLPDIRSRNATQRSAAERNAVNTPIQGSGADLIKTAMVRVSDAFRERRFGAKMVLQIHDELLFDVPREEVDEVCPVIEQCMVHAIELDIPIEVDIGVGPTWLDAH
jgi:DNA polymerase-1